MNREKEVRWIDTSLDDIKAFPREAMIEAGYQLNLIQHGLDPENFKWFKAVGAGVKEIRIKQPDSIFRVMYVAKFDEAVYVLHCFQKKDEQTLKKDVDLAKKRYDGLMNQRIKNG
ncbi:MAG: phage-related protein [Motiliproteus sp.]